MRMAPRSLSSTEPYVVLVGASEQVAAHMRAQLSAAGMQLRHVPPEQLRTVLVCTPVHAIVVMANCLRASLPIIAASRLTTPTGKQPLVALLIMPQEKRPILGTQEMCRAIDIVITHPASGSYMHVLMGDPANAGQHAEAKHVRRRKRASLFDKVPAQQELSCE